jgi:hypothetical protein
MKVSKVVAVFSMLCAIAYFISSFFHPLPQGPYGSFIFSMVMLVSALRILWPGFEAFLARLPLAVRFLFPIICAFTAFMDIKTSGFTLLGLIVYVLAGITAGEILSLKRR